MNFIKPVKYGKLIKDNPKTYTYFAEPSDSIVAPISGVVYNVDQNKCDGFIQLAHLIDKTIYYSEICGINGTIFVANGMDVKQGDILAHTSNREVQFEIKDSNLSKTKIEPFFLKSEPEKTKEPKVDDSKKEPKKKEEEEKNKKEKFEPESTDLSKRSKELPDLFTSLLLTPIDIANKAFTFKKKEKETKEEELNEEIKRFRKLIL